MGAQRNVQDEMAGAADTSGEERIVRLDGGVRWRASVVARLISEDIAAARSTPRGSWSPRMNGAAKDAAAPRSCSVSRRAGAAAGAAACASTAWATSESRSAL